MTRFAVVVLLTGILTNAATACDETASVFPRPCPPVPLDRIPAPALANGQSALPAEAPSDLDRRDRIFYPGDTERLKTPRAEVAA